MNFWLDKCGWHESAGLHMQLVRSIVNLTGERNISNIGLLLVHKIKNLLCDVLDANDIGDCLKAAEISIKLDLAIDELFKEVLPGR